MTKITRSVLLRRVRFEEANDESPHSSRESRRYRLHGNLTRVCKKPCLCNEAFLKSMGITFSAGDNNATTRRSREMLAQLRKPTTYTTVSLIFYLNPTLITELNLESLSM